MSESRPAAPNSVGTLEPNPAPTFGLREAALAGVAVSPDAAAGRPDVFGELSALTFTWHITCSLTNHQSTVDE